MFSDLQNISPQTQSMAEPNVALLDIFLSPGISISIKRVFNIFIMSELF